MKKNLWHLFCAFIFFSGIFAACEKPVVTYKVEHYQQNLLNDEYTLFETETLEGQLDSMTGASAKSYTGFTVVSNWQQVQVTENDTVVKIYYNRNNHLIKYQVKHYQQNLLNDEYKLVETETLEAERGTMTNAAEKNYKGFTAVQEWNQVKVKDLNAVVKIYYDRNIYKVTYKDENGKIIDSKEYRYGSPVKIESKGKASKDNYVFCDWATSEGKSSIEAIEKDETAGPYFSKDTQDRDYDGILDSEDSNPDSNKFTGAVRYTISQVGNFSENTFPIEFAIDFKKVVENDNKVYSKDIGKMLAPFCCDGWKECAVQFEGSKRVNRTLNVNTVFPAEFGFTDIKQLCSESSLIDSPDEAWFVAGHHDFVYGMKFYSVILVNCLGTQSDKEWISNFDVGGDVPRYYENCGTNHPDWTNRKMHKGFNVTANRVKRAVDKYIEENVSEYAEKIIMITGHSRGATIGNIIGTWYEKEGKYKSYTYTFAASGSTTEDDYADYKTVFYYSNKDDIVTAIPAKEWGFHIYGTPIAADVSAEQNLLDFFKKTAGKAYTPSKLKEWYEDFVIVNSVEELFKTDYTQTAKIKYSEADMKTYLMGNLYEPAEKNGEYYICPAFALRFMGHVISCPALNMIVELQKVSFDENSIYTKLQNDLMQNINGIAYGHFFISYYTLLENVTP